MQKTDINFFKAAELVKEHKNRNLWKIFGNILLIALVCSINLFMYLFIDYTDKQIDIGINNNSMYMLDASNLEKQAEYKKLKAEIDAIKAATESIQVLDKQIAKIEEFNIQFYNKIMLLKPDRVEISDISFTSENLEIKCTTKDNSPPADYALALDGSGIFEEIKYEGFEAEGSENGTWVRFSVQCTIKRGEQNEN